MEYHSIKTDIVRYYLLPKFTEFKFWHKSNNLLFLREYYFIKTNIIRYYFITKLNKNLNLLTKNC